MANNLSGYFNSNGSIEIKEINNEIWVGNIYYITGIVLPPGRKFNIRVPNKDKNDLDENGKKLVGFNFSVNAETEETTIIEDTTT